MARYFIIFLLAATAFLFPVLQSSYTQKMKATENVARNYDISVARNAASSYASMILYEISETLGSSSSSVSGSGSSSGNRNNGGGGNESSGGTSSGKFNVDNYNFTETNTTFYATTITSELTELTSGTYHLKITATKNNCEAIFEVNTNPVALSYFGYFMNGSQSRNEYFFGDSNIWESIDGPIHINGDFGVGGVPGPEILGDIDLFGQLYYYDGLDRDNWTRFGGDQINERVSKIYYPNHMNFIQKHDAFDLDALFSFAPYDNNLYLQLGDDAHGNGIVEIYAVPYDDPQLSNPAYALQNKRTILISDLKAVTGLDENLLFSQIYKVHIQGTLNGQLTISGWNDFYITDDIYLKDDPTVNPDSDDVLGIFTKHDLYIASREKEYTPSVYYNEDGVTVFANIFTGQNLLTEDLQNWSGPRRRGFFTVYGSRAQHKNDCTYAGYPNYRGFFSKLIYDHRFKNIAPPAAYITNRRRFSDFKESYRIISS